MKPIDHQRRLALLAFVAVALPGVAGADDRYTVTYERLTNNEVPERYVDISEGRVAWSIWRNGPVEDQGIYVWKDGKIVDKLDGVQVTIDGEEMAWTLWDEKWRLYYSDGASTQEIVDFQYGSYIAVSMGRIVWQASSGINSEIHLWDGEDVHRLTDNDLGDETPHLSGSTIVWHHGNDHDEEGGSSRDEEIIIEVDGDRFEPKAKDAAISPRPRAGGDWVVWIESVGTSNSSFEVMLWDGEDVHRLTDNLIREWEPDTDGQHVVWADEQHGLWFWDGEVAQNISLPNSSAVHDPRVSGMQVVWRQWMPVSSEVYLATLVPEPSHTLLCASALTTLALLRSRRA